MASVAPGLGFVLGGAIAATLMPPHRYLLAGASALAALARATATLRNADWTCVDAHPLRASGESSSGSWCSS